MTSLVVWCSELLTTNHEVPGSIPGSTMGIFPCRWRIPMVTMVWVVSRIRRKLETSVTRSHTSINSDWIHDRDLLAGGNLTTLTAASTSAHRVPSTLIPDYGREKRILTSWLVIIINRNTRFVLPVLQPLLFPSKGQWAGHVPVYRRTTLTVHWPVS